MITAMPGGRTRLRSLGLPVLLALGTTGILLGLSCKRSTAPVGAFPPKAPSAKAPPPIVAAPSTPSAAPKAETAHPIDMALDEREVFVAMSDGEIVAVPKAGGPARSVTGAHWAAARPPGQRVGLHEEQAREVVELRVSDALYILDHKWSLWTQAKVGGSSRTLVSSTLKGFVATSDGAIAMTIIGNDDAVFLSVRGAGAGDGSMLNRFTASRTTTGHHLGSDSEILDVRGPDLIVGYLFNPRPASPYWFEMELAFLRIGGGPLRPFARSASKVHDVASAGECLYWYETGWRGPEWGGGYGACRLMAMRLPSGSPTVVRQMGSPENMCDVEVRFGASPSGVFYVVADDGVLRSQPACGGAETVVASGLGHTIGPKYDNHKVFWVDAEGQVHSIHAR